MNTVPGPRVRASSVRRRARRLPSRSDAQACLRPRPRSAGARRRRPFVRGRSPLQRARSVASRDTSGSSRPSVGLLHLPVPQRRIEPTRNRPVSVGGARLRSGCVGVAGGDTPPADAGTVSGVATVNVVDDPNVTSIRSAWSPIGASHMQSRYVPEARGAVGALSRRHVALVEDPVAVVRGLGVSPGTWTLVPGSRYGVGVAGRSTRCAVLQLDAHRLVEERRDLTGDGHDGRCSRRAGSDRERVCQRLARPGDRPPERCRRQSRCRTRSVPSSRGVQLALPGLSWTVVFSQSDHGGSRAPWSEAWPGQPVAGSARGTRIAGFVSPGASAV